jgi:hypothetical protein
LNNGRELSGGMLCLSADQLTTTQTQAQIGHHNLAICFFDDRQVKLFVFVFAHQTKPVQTGDMTFRASHMVACMKIAMAQMKRMTT